MSREHEQFMAKAIAESVKAWGKVHPNPHVGAVIVENGQVVARGHHEVFGEAHAEVNAFKNLGRKPSESAVLYVTLEPCSTCGNTGACTDVILESGIQNVVIGAIDPNPAHQGKGVDLLREAGLSVVTGVLKEECENLNLIFNFNQQSGRPLIAGKVACTLDGKIATGSGSSQWITGEMARMDVMSWRQYFPSIGVGAGTVLADDPSLTCRRGVEVNSPIRFVFDRSLQTVSELDNLKVFNDEFKDLTIVIVSRGADIGPFERKGIACWDLPEGELFWEEFSKLCNVHSIPAVFLEGGAGLLSDLLAAKSLDYLFCYRAPKFLADEEAKSFVTGQSISSMGDAFTLKDVRHMILGEDQLMRGFVEYPNL